MHLPEINTIVNFGVLFVGLAFLFRKKLPGVFDAKRDALAKDVEESESLRAQAQAMFQEYETKLEKLDGEVAEILSKAKQAGEEERARILKRAEAQAERIVAEAQRAADREGFWMQKNLQDAAFDEALRLAQGILAEKLGTAEHERMVDTLLTNVEGRA